VIEASGMTSEEWQIVWFTAWVSALSTLVITPLGLAIAWLLARRDWLGKSIVETLVSLPLVMPPVATGLILTAPGVPMIFMGQEFLEDKYWSDWPGHPELLIYWEGLEGKDQDIFKHPLTRTRATASIKLEMVDGVQIVESSAE